MLDYPTKNELLELRPFLTGQELDELDKLLQTGGTVLEIEQLAHFTDKQMEAVRRSDAVTYFLFGGSRGPGKSYFLRWNSVRRLVRWFEQGLPGVRVMLACEDYPTLYERQISKVEVEFPPSLGTFHFGRSEFRLADRLGGGAIAFRNLDNPSKYQSAEFAGIAIDEIAKNRESTFHILRGSLRWPGIEDVYLMGASNPEANWVRDYWLERRLPMEMYGLEDRFDFLPAMPEDNPHLHPSYWQMLDTLKGPLRLAWRYGDWYAHVEGLVYSSFSPENVVDMGPDPERPYEIAIDDGYTDPRATLFIQRRENGDILVFAELYERQTLEEVTITNMQALAGYYGLGKPRRVIVSHEAAALRARIAAAGMNPHNWLSETVSGESSTRLAAITMTRSLICDGNGHRAILINRRCEDLLDEIRSGYKYPEGKRGLSERPMDGNDHACNALESYVWSSKPGSISMRQGNVAGRTGGPIVRRATKRA